MKKNWVKREDVTSKNVKAALSGLGKSAKMIAASLVDLKIKGEYASCPLYVFLSNRFALRGKRKVYFDVSSTSVAVDFEDFSGDGYSGFSVTLNKPCQTFVKNIDDGDKDHYPGVRGEWEA